MIVYEPSHYNSPHPSRALRKSASCPPIVLYTTRVIPDLSACFKLARPTASGFFYFCSLHRSLHQGETNTPM